MRAGIAAKNPVIKFTKSALRIRNFVRYWRAFGFRASILIGMQRLKNPDLIEVPVKGLNNRVFFRARGSDMFCLISVLGRATPAVQKMISPRLIVDAGANAGYTTLLYSRLYPGCRIVSVEPEADNCKLFKKNCGKYDNIQLLEGALWVNSSYLQISNPTADSFSFQVAEPEDPRRATVKSYTVHDILKNSGESKIDILKLDIEGAEKCLFESEEAKEWIHFIDYMVVELHERLVPGCNKAFSELISHRRHSCSQSGEYVIVQFHK